MKRILSNVAFGIANFGVIVAVLFIASVLFAQSQDKTAQITAKPDLSAKAEVAKPDIIPLNENEGCVVDRQSLKIENAALRAQVAQLQYQVAQSETQAARTDGNAMVADFFKKNGVDANLYDFVADQKTGKYSLVRKAKP